MNNKLTRLVAGSVAALVMGSASVVALAATSARLTSAPEVVKSTPVADIDCLTNPSEAICNDDMV